MSNIKFVFPIKGFGSLERRLVVLWNRHECCWSFIPSMLLLENKTALKYLLLSFRRPNHSEEGKKEKKNVKYVKCWLFSSAFLTAVCRNSLHKNKKLKSKRRLFLLFPTASDAGGSNLSEG